MTMFPTLSVKPDQKHFSEKRENPASGAKAEGGYEYTRPKFTRRPRRMFTTGYTNISSTDKLALENFWDAVKGGSAAFQWPHPTTGELIMVRVTAQKSLDFSYSHYAKNADGSDDHRWNVGVLELKEV